MGRWASSPPTDRRVAGVTLPSAVGTGPPHHAIRGKPTSQSHRRGPHHRRYHWTSNGFIGSHVPATRPRRRRTVRPAPSSFVSFVCYGESLHGHRGQAEGVVQLAVGEQ